LSLFFRPVMVAALLVCAWPVYVTDVLAPVTLKEAGVMAIEPLA
jgi:hypothetical protein